MNHNHGKGLTLPIGNPTYIEHKADSKPLVRLIGAFVDNCDRCYRSHRAEVSKDAATTAFLVDLTCCTLHDAGGGMPSSLGDDNDPDIMPSEFREMARIWMRDPGTPDTINRMVEACKLFTVQERDRVVYGAMHGMAHALPVLALRKLAGQPFTVRDGRR